MEIKNIIIKEYFKEIFDLMQREQNRKIDLLSYAENLVKDNDSLIDQLVSISQKRNESEEKVRQIARLMAIYNCLQLKNIQKPLDLNELKIYLTEVPLEAIILAGGGGSRLSLIGAGIAKPALSIPQLDLEDGKIKFKSLIDFTLIETINAGYNGFIFCGNGLTDWLKEHCSNIKVPIKYVEKYTSNKKEAMHEAVELVNPDSIAVLRSPADIYRHGDLITHATALHFSSGDPENKITIIGKRVNPNESGLSSTAYVVKGNNIISLQRVKPYDPIESNQFLGIKLGTIIGRKKLSLFKKYGSNETNETYNKIAYEEPGSLVYFDGSNSKTMNVDDPFDLERVISMTIGEIDKLRRN